MKWLVYDVESTGLNTRTDRIVEFGAVLYEDREEVKRESSIINPEMVMNDQVIAIHNITNEMASKGAKWREYAVAKLIPLFEECDVYVGHNIFGFDNKILKSNLDRVGLQLPDRRSVDSLVISRRFLESKRYALGRLCARYGIYIDRAHRALDDTIANAQLIIAIADELKMTIEEILQDEAVCLGKAQAGRDPFDGLFAFQNRI